MSPGVAPVPLISGKLSSVLEPAVICPVIVPTLSIPINGAAAGGVVSVRGVSTGNENKGGTVSVVVLV